MIDIDNMSSKTLIKEQYKNTDNLELRKGLHDKYSVADEQAQIGDMKSDKQITLADAQSVLRIALKIE